MNEFLIFLKESIIVSVISQQRIKDKTETLNNNHVRMITFERSNVLIR